MTNQPIEPSEIRKAAAFVEALNRVCEKFAATLWPDEDDGTASLPFMFERDGQPGATWRAEPLTPQSDKFGLVVPR